MKKILYLNGDCKIKRPNFCKRCGKNSVFHFHSKYRRKKLLSKSSWLTDFFVFRFRCKVCKKVVPAYQECYVPNRQATPATEGISMLNDFDLLKDFFSLRTLTRWRTRLKFLAITFQSPIFKIILFRFPNTSINTKCHLVFNSLLELYKLHMPTNALESLTFQLGHLQYLARGNISHHKRCL